MADCWTFALVHDSGPDHHEGYKTCGCTFAKITRTKMEEIKLVENKDGTFDASLAGMRKSLNGFQHMNEEDKKQRRLKLFSDRTFHARSLVVEGENGKNFDGLIEHIKFLEECIKDLKTAHSAAELAKLGFIQEASAIERSKIAEADKKYKPQFADREKTDNAKMTMEEKKIQGFIKLGLSRAAAEKIIFGR